MNVIIIACVTVLASCVGILSGFGLGTIMTPVLLLWLPFEQTILFVAIIHWFHNIWKILFFHHGIKWDVFMYFGVTSVVASFLGALLVSNKAGFLLTFLGVFLIAYSVLLFFLPRFHVRYNRINALFGGGISGFFAGIFGIRGALRSVFLSAYDLPKATYLGTIGAISFLIDTTRISVYLINGISLSSVLQWGMIIFIPTSLIGAYIGRYLVDKIPQKKFRIMIALFLFIMGLRLLFIP